MKKLIIIMAVLAAFIDVKAQVVTMHNDTTFMGFPLDHNWDTVAEGEQYYMFPARPDSGLHFMRVALWRHQKRWYFEIDSLGDSVQKQVIDTFPYRSPLEIWHDRIGQRYHTDSTVQIYGIAATLFPAKWVHWGRREGMDQYSLTEFREPLDYNITQFQYELLRKTFDGTDSVMTLIDSLKLDASTTTKRCWFRYDIDSADTEKFVKQGPYSSAHEYYPGQSEVVVPCYEFYFENPFDSIYTLTGDFYVGRNNLGIYEYNQPFYYSDIDMTKTFWPLEYCPFFYDLDSADATFIWYDSNGQIIDSDTSTAGSIYNFPLAGVTLSSNGNAIKRPWGLIFPITGLRCGQLHHVQLAEKGEAYALWTWQGGEDDDDTPMYQIRLIDNRKEDGGVIASSTQSDTSYMCTNLDEYGDYTFKIRKSCHYATSHYDTVVWSDWYSYPFVMKEKPVDTTTVDTTIVDTTIVDTTIVDTTGIRLSLGDADYSLSPNPAHGSAVLRLQYPVAETAELSLFDMRGREVRRLTLKRDTKTVRLDLQGLPSGAYLLKLLTPRGLSTRRLLVQ